MMMTLLGISPGFSRVESQVSFTRLTPWLGQSENSDCCFLLSYDRTTENNDVNLIEIRALDGYDWQSFEPALDEGWLANRIEGVNGFRLFRSEGAVLPARAESLTAWCGRSGAGVDSVRYEVRWLLNDLERNRDTLILDCIDCITDLRDSLVCRPDGGYDYYHRFSNRSGYPVNALRIRKSAEETGPPDWWEDRILGNGDHVTFSDPVPNGGLAPWTVFPVRPGLEEGAEICFELTTSRNVAQGELDCCSAYRCVPLPACDRCCGSYDEFAADVAAGFRVAFSSGNFCDSTRMEITPLELLDCDQTKIRLRPLSQLSGLSVQGRGNQTATFPSLPITDDYEICLTVERENQAGASCFTEATLVKCDTVAVNCEDCFESALVDSDFACGSELTFSCGCDSMIYLNDCTAEKWAGLRRLFTDTVACYQPDTVMELSLTQGNTPFAVELSWNLTSSVAFRFFMLRCRSLPGGTWTVIAELPPETMNYRHLTESPGRFEYEVVGVAPSGKLFGSRPEIISGTKESYVDSSIGTLYPNPSTDYVRIKEVSKVHRLQWYNRRGRVLVSYENENIPPRWDISGWPTGIYYVRIQLHNGMTSLRKLVKI